MAESTLYQNPTYSAFQTLPTNQGTYDIQKYLQGLNTSIPRAGATTQGSALDISQAGLYDAMKRQADAEYNRIYNPTAMQSVQDWAPTAFGAINTAGSLYGMFGSGGTMDMNKANIEAQKTNVASLKQNMADKAEFKTGVRSAFA